MDYDKTLPFTGMGIVIGGTVISGPWIVAIAIGMVALGALLVRLGFRRKRRATQR